MPALRFATFLAPGMEPVYRAVANAVAQRLGLDAVLTTGRDYRMLERGEADVVFLCSPPYLWLTDRPAPLLEAVAAPVLSDPELGGRPVYVSDVIVHPAAPFDSFGDLRGASFAFNEPWSWSGYEVVRHELVRIGSVEGFFGRVMESGFHRRSIRLVADGTVDAAAIDRQVRLMEMRDHPELAERIRVIDRLGPAPIQPVAASTALPPAVRAELGEAFARLHEDPALTPVLATGFVDRFVRVTDAHYDEVRTWMGEIAAADLHGFGPDRSPDPGTRTP